MNLIDELDNQLLEATELICQPFQEFLKQQKNKKTELADALEDKAFYPYKWPRRIGA